MSCPFFTLNHNEGAVSETGVWKYSEEFKEHAVRRLMPPNSSYTFRSAGFWWKNKKIMQVLR
jgi:hypothetical protein